MSTFALCSAPASGWLVEFVGGDLDAARAADVRDHLVGCAGCRREAAALQQSLKVLRGAAAVAAPGVDEAMFSAMHERVLVAIKDADPPNGRVAASRRPWLLASMLAAASFLLGWLLVPQAAPQMLDRKPIVPALVDHHPLAWPTANVPMQQLGQLLDAEGNAVSLPIGRGMMGRLELSALEQVTPMGLWPADEATPTGAGRTAGGPGSHDSEPAAKPHVKNAIGPF